jgi:hypothetical protein
MAKAEPLSSGTDCDALLQRMIALWNVPLEERTEMDRQYAFVRNRKVLRADVLSALLSEFGAEAVTRCSESLLSAVAETCFRDEVPDRRQIFLATCVLDIVNAGDAVRLSMPTVEKVVQAYPVPIWYGPVGALVRGYLDRAELVRTLSDCLEFRQSSFLRLSCLEALIMYLPLAAPAPLDAMTASTTAIHAKLDTLADDPDVEVKKAARRAQATLRRHEADLA